MGILLSDNGQDAALLYDVLICVCEARNDQLAASTGLFFTVKEGATEPISHAGGQLMADCFPVTPELPSAFKRIASLLLVAAIHPFLIVRVRQPSGTWDTAEGGKHLPHVIQLILDAIPVFLFVLRAECDKGWVNLNHWNGFVTPQFEMELASFLLWLGNAELMKMKGAVLVYDTQKLSRIALGTSLIIEASYGQITCPPHELIPGPIVVSFSDPIE